MSLNIQIGCIEGYTGSNCSENINNCDPNPCENGASCKDEVADYSCLCLDGYTGKNCSTDINDCDPNPCENGASCRDEVADYSCLCLSHYTGKNCSTGFGDCYPNPCTCRSMYIDGSCICPDKHYGLNCSFNTDGCDPNACMRDVCYQESRYYDCICEKKDYGMSCSLVSLTPTNHCTIADCYCDFQPSECCLNCYAYYRTLRGSIDSSSSGERGFVCSIEL